MSSISANPLKTGKFGKAGKTIATPFKKYANFLEVGEQFNRFAEFKKVLKETGDVNKARVAAANVTVNFGKGGSLLKLIDKWVPYSNAAMQGVVKSWQTLKNKPLQTIAKSIVSSTIPAALAYYYNNSDSSRRKVYNEIPNDVKNSNFVFVANDNTIIKIPKNHQSGLIFGSLGERLYDYFAKNDKEAFTGMPTSLEQTFVPVNIRSGIISPALNIAMGGNKNYFGQEIVPRSMENLSPKNQYDEKTTSLSKFIGQQFNLSPKKTDYLLDSYAGIIYDLMKKTSQVKEDNLLVKGAKSIADTAVANFTVNPNYTRTTDNYYNMVDKIKQEKADFDKSIADKKAKVKSMGLSLSSNQGKEYLDSLMSEKNISKNNRFKNLTNIINDQMSEMSGLSTKKRKKMIEKYYKELNNLYKSRE
jgi:hypothetical protein